MRSATARSASHRGDNDDHADAAVEHAMHLRIGDVALLLQPVEDRRARPARAFEPRLHVTGQHARHVFDEAAAGDVRHALDPHVTHERAAAA